MKKLLFIVTFLLIPAFACAMYTENNDIDFNQNFNYIYEKKSTNNNSTIFISNLVFGVFSEIVSMNKCLRAVLLLTLNIFAIQNYEDKKKNNKESTLDFEEQGIVKSVCLGTLGYFAGSRITDFIKSYYIRLHKKELGTPRFVHHYK